jgi:hypothetical protein
MSPDPDLLKKFMRNECSPVEQRVVIDWLQETTREERIEYMKAHVYEMDEEPEEPVEPLPPEDIELLRQKLQGQSRRPQLPKWPMVSVIVIALLVIVIWCFLFFKRR